MDDIYDVVIIGGGPAGLTAAQYTARLGLNVVVLDKSKTAGALAFTSKIENYPGVGPINGSDLLDIFRNQAQDFGAKYVESQIAGVKLEGDVKEVYAMDNVYKGKTVIIATGAMGRKPSLKGEEAFLGRGVSYCAICDAAFYKGKNVCIIGDSAEAAKEAELLTRFTDKVSLVTPSKKLSEDSFKESLEEKKVKIILYHKILEITGNDVVEKVILENRNNGERVELPMDGVFVYLHGNKPVIDYLNFAVDLSDEECVITNKVMETNIDGVFAAGDVSCTEARQVVVAASDGCLAALSAEKYINKGKKRKYAWG